MKFIHKSRYSFAFKDESFHKYNFVKYHLHTDKVRIFKIVDRRDILSNRSPEIQIQHSDKNKCVTWINVNNSTNFIFVTDEYAKKNDEHQQWRYDNDEFYV